MPRDLFPALPLGPVLAESPASHGVSPGEVSLISWARSWSGWPGARGVFPLPSVSTSGSGVAPVLEVTLKPNRQGHCLPVPWSFGATFSLGKVPVFIYKNRISLNGAICLQCFLGWRLPRLTVGVIKGTGSPF